MFALFSFQFSTFCTIKVRTTIFTFPFFFQMNCFSYRVCFPGKVRLSEMHLQRKWLEGRRSGLQSFISSSMWKGQETQIREFH